MVTTVSRREFEQVLRDQGVASFGRLGYRPKDDQPCTFLLESQELVKGFICVRDRSLTHFRVQVGVSASALLPKIQVINRSRHVGLQLSRLLGEFPNSIRGVPTCYYFKTPGQLASAVNRMYADFVQEALPWLDSLQSIEDLARGYWQRWLTSFIHGESPGPPAGVLAMYGWLLQESGHTDEAQPWLQRAHAGLSQPVHTPNDRVVPAGPNGSAQIRLSPELARLKQLIAESLTSQADKG